MKSNLFVILVVVCLFPVLAKAQIISNYGVKTAFTRSMFEIEQDFNFSTWRSGFNVAVYAGKNVSEFVSFLLQLEVPGVCLTAHYFTGTGGLES